MQEKKLIGSKGELINNIASKIGNNNNNNNLALPPKLVKKKKKIWLIIYAPNLEEVEGANCFGFVCVRDSMIPFVTLFDACHILRTVNARVLKCHIWIPHRKIADKYFFSCPIYLPWSYAPLKKSE